LIGTALTLSACSITPNELTLEENLLRIENDTKALFKDQAEIDGAITLYEAMARALKYNMDQRLKIMQVALTKQELTTANLSLLPKLTLEAGYTGRNNDLGSNSQSLDDGSESLESSTSSDRNSKTASLGFTWNVLDFGLSYIRAQQRADRVLIAEERRRKVVHNLIQDVREAFWNAASAERVLQRINPLMQRVQSALQDARRGRSSGQEAPLSALRYQRELLDSLRQLKSLRRELNTAKTRLAALMNLKPGTSYNLDTTGASFDVPKIDLGDVERLEKIALLHRPELREEAYSARINHKDIRKEYVRLLPGLELETAWNFDSNSYAYEQTWWSWGTSISKNLFDVFNAPQAIERAETKAEVAAYRRYALSLAVMSQVHISLASYTQAVDEFKTVSELFDVESGIKESVSANVRAGSVGRRDMIQAELQAILSELRRDMAFSRVRNAVGRLYISLGADPLPEAIENDDIGTLSNALEAINEDWFSGQVDMMDLSGVERAVEMEKAKTEEADKKGFFTSVSSWFD